jgi:hypothetical protein
MEWMDLGEGWYLVGSRVYVVGYFNWVSCLVCDRYDFLGQADERVCAS